MQALISKSRFGGLHLLAFVLLMTGALGCTTTKPSLPPPSSATAQELGNIAVVFRGPANSRKLERPPLKQDLVREYAKRGAFFGEDEFHAGPDVSLGLAVAWMPVGALFGAVSGAVAERIAQKEEPNVQRAFIALTNALAEARFEQSFRDKLLESIRRNTPHSVERAPGSVLLEKGELKLDGTNIDTLVSVTLEDAALRAGEGIGSALALTAHLRFRIIRLQGRKELDDDQLKFRSEKRSFIDWGENNAQPLRTAMEHCQQTLTDSLVRRLFLPTPDF